MKFYYENISKIFILIWLKQLHPPTFIVEFAENPLFPLVLQLRGQVLLKRQLHQLTLTRVMHRSARRSKHVFKRRKGVFTNRR